MITAEALREVLNYDPETGVFTWLIQPSIGTPIGSTAGSVSNGYILIGFKGRSYPAHRLAWLYVKGKWPQREIDHKNGDRSDNRIKNLRTASRRQNRQNSKAHSTNKLGLKGVCLHKPNGKYRATICVEGKPKCLGYFDDPKEAHQAYVWAARRYFGKFARFG